MDWIFARLRPALISAVLAIIPLSLSAQSDEAAAARYETLLEALRTAQNPSEASQISGEIWEYWLSAPDEVAQAVLDAAMERRRAYDFLGAIAELDRLIEDYPDFPEGWNQRATIHFLAGDFEASLADVAETLAREPRHFGALSGKAMILYRQGKLPSAQIAVREALKYHPFLSERALLDINPGKDL